MKLFFKYPWWDANPLKIAPVISTDQVKMSFPEKGQVDHLAIKVDETAILPSNVHPASWEPSLSPHG